MNKTFVMRRNDIIQEARDVTAILKEYPFLGFEDEVSSLLYPAIHFVFICIFTCIYHT